MKIGVGNAPEFSAKDLSPGGKESCHMANGVMKDTSNDIHEKDTSFEGQISREEHYYGRRKDSQRKRIVKTEAINLRRQEEPSF